MSELDDLENYVDTVKNVLLGLNYAAEYGEEFDLEKAVYFLQRSLEENVSSDASITNHIKFLIGKICLENDIDQNDLQNHLKLIEESA